MCFVLPKTKKKSSTLKDSPVYFRIHVNLTVTRDRKIGSNFFSNCSNDKPRTGQILWRICSSWTCLICFSGKQTNFYHGLNFTCPKKCQKLLIFKGFQWRYRCGRFGRQLCRRWPRVITDQFWYKFEVTPIKTSSGTNLTYLITNFCGFGAQKHDYLTKIGYERGQICSRTCFNGRNFKCVLESVSYDPWPPST